jgi:hypothetical protein
MGRPVESKPSSVWRLPRANSRDANTPICHFSPGTRPYYTCILPEIFEYLSGIGDSVSYSYLEITIRVAPVSVPTKKLPVSVSKNCPVFIPISGTRPRYLSRFHPYCDLWNHLSMIYESDSKLANPTDNNDKITNATTYSCYSSINEHKVNKITIS